MLYYIRQDKAGSRGTLYILLLCRLLFPVETSDPLKAMAFFFGSLEDNVILLATQAGILLLVYWLIWVVYSRTWHPLAKVPGPVWPSLSRTWLMYRMYLGDYQLAQEALHKKYLSKYTQVVPI